MTNTSTAKANPENGKDSLVQEALRARGHQMPRDLKPMEEIPPERVMIGTVEELFRVAREVFDAQRLTPEDAVAVANNRTVLALWQAPVANRLGRVDTAIWKFQVGKALDAKLAEQTASQPNGRWKLLEAQIESREQVRTVEFVVGDIDSVTGEFRTELRSERYGAFVVAFKLVDMLGDDDIEYHLGQPVRTPKVKAGMDAEAFSQWAAMFSTFQKQGSLATSGEDVEKAALRAELDALKAQVNALVASRGRKGAAASD